MTAPAIEVEALRKEYPRKAGAPQVALAGVSLAIAPGEVFALLGPNGAGKTTLVGCLTGLVRPTSGAARVLGHDTQRGYLDARRASGVVPQELNFDPFLTVEAAVRYQASYFGVRLDEAGLTAVLDSVGLGRQRATNTRALSGGMKRRLLIAKALAHAPRALFLDEPTAGVDAEARRGLWQHFGRLRADGVTILLTTHDLDEAEAVADRIGLIDGGELRIVLSRDELRAQFGRRRVRVHLAAPITALPPIDGHALTLAPDGRSLEAQLAADAPLGPLLAAILAAGLALRDVETQARGLDEIYPELLAAARARAAP
jgi:ABC-2 type transport system ATP-binding protein